MSLRGNPEWKNEIEHIIRNETDLKKTVNT